MTLPAPTYDLVLLLDSEAEEQAREKILADAREAIAAQGELLRDDAWGERALTYPIAHKATAKYHLLQFHAGSPELLSGLDRTLRIADEVVRFRIVKLKPGTPAAPDMSAPGASVASVPGTSSAHASAPGTSSAHASAPGTSSAHASAPGTSSAHASAPGTSSAHAAGAAPVVEAAPAVVEVAPTSTPEPALEAELAPETPPAAVGEPDA